MTYFNGNKEQPTVVFDATVGLFKSKYSEFGFSTPAILLDTQVGILHKYGDVTDVRKSLENYKARDTTGIVTKDMMVLPLLVKAGREDETAELLTRMIDCSGYVSVWYKEQKNIIDVE